MPTDSMTMTPQLENALRILADGDHLFLTGKAGTGKSTLIRRFIEQTDRRVVVAAPTGIAALNVGGYTLHRLFSFQPGTTLNDILEGNYRPGRFRKTLASLETLIIDEVSMVRADVFDMVEAALERFGPSPGKPFGDVQIVLVGDLFQLPPVVRATEEDYFRTRYDTPYFFSADAFEPSDFPTVALTTVFRQVGDTRLTNILNAIREGILLADAQDEINARTDADFEPPDEEFWLTLAPTNSIVTARNRERLARLPDALHEQVAVITGDIGGFDLPVEERLQFKVGAQIMMLTNDSSDRWVNGTLARITSISGTSTDRQVGVEFRDGRVTSVSQHTWEATVPVLDGGVLRREVVGTFRQLPFKLAWAITIHKSQGQTLDRLVVDLSGGAFDFGQVYVALSRCTTIDGLVLTRPVMPKDLKTDRRVLRFLHQSTSSQSHQSHCAIGILTVGEEGRLSRPRPVEIAVAFDDGTAVSTLVNPQRDLADARVRYNITTDDVLLAPTLAEAWASFAPLLEGATPVGIGIDETLGLIDFELKRLGTVAPLPLGVDLPAPRSDDDSGRRPTTALQVALSMLTAYQASQIPLPAGSAFAPVETSRAEVGYLLTRDPQQAPPQSDLLPWLSQLLDVSRLVGTIVLGDHANRIGEVAPTPRRELDPSVTDLIVRRVCEVAARVSVIPPTLSERLRRLEQELGVIIPVGSTPPNSSSALSIDQALSAGARVCFTGEATTSNGAVVSRQVMEERAQRVGLVPVRNVSKTRCDVLLVAEIGTQSGKARKAVEYSKPIFSTTEFLDWISRQTEQ